MSSESHQHTFNMANHFVCPCGKYPCEDIQPVGGGDDPNGEWRCVGCGDRFENEGAASDHLDAFREERKLRYEERKLLHSQKTQ